MTDYTYATIIIEAANQSAAQLLTTDQYFIVGASETGEAPATYYFSSGPFDNSEVDALMNDKFKKWVRFENWQEALTSLNLTKLVEIDADL